MTLGQKIKKLRIGKDLTQKELADQVHVTFQTVSKWEKDENEPDVSTLRELARLFDCSLDYLLSEDEKEQTKEELVETPVVISEEPVTKTIIIHQKELHVCTRCKKDIPEDELEIDKVCVRNYHRGHPAEYRDDYYHRECLAEVNKERAARKAAQAKYHAQRSKKLSFGWGIAGAVVTLGLCLGLFLGLPQCQEVMTPLVAVMLSIVFSYMIFADLYCILSGSYVGDVFLSVAGWSIKFPGLIFSWDLDGIMWLIAMKLLFVVLGFFLGVLVLFLAVALSAVLASVSFPFVLVHNINTGYADAF